MKLFSAHPETQEVEEAPKGASREYPEQVRESEVSEQEK